MTNLWSLTFNILINTVWNKLHPSQNYRFIIIEFSWRNNRFPNLNWLNNWNQGNEKDTNFCLNNQRVLLE